MNLFSTQKITITLAFALTTVMALPAIASAAPPASSVSKRQVRQNVRVIRGVKNGSITRNEARRLRTEQRNIRQTKRRMLRNDGRINKRERRRLNRMQNRANRHIKRARHNNRARR